MFSAKAMTEIGFSPNSPSTPVGKGSRATKARQTTVRRTKPRSTASSQDMKRWWAAQ
jgi:hypothetical protein